MTPAQFEEEAEALLINFTININKLTENASDIDIKSTDSIRNMADIYRAMANETDAVADKYDALDKQFKKEFTND